MKQLVRVMQFIAYITILVNPFFGVLAALPSTASIIESPPNSISSALPTSTPGSTASAGQCLTYPSNGVCSKYVNYAVYAGNISLEVIEAMLQPLELLSSSLGTVAPQCVDSMYRYQCSQMYAECNSSATESPTWLPSCQATCVLAKESCEQVLTGAGYASMLPNCSMPSFTYHIAPASDGSCNNIPAQVSAASANNSTISLPNGYILPECPAPFLKDPLATAGTNNSVSPDSCSNGCCIPCPVQDYLYPVGWVAKGFIATDVIRTISAVCALFLVISYAILPDKRTHPSLLIFEFSIALFLYSADVVFALGNPKRIQCSTDIVASTQDNNVLCAAQGSILIYSSLAMAMWVSAVIVNLHLHIVWNSKFLVNKYWALNILCWGCPLIVTVITLVYRQINYEFANTCIVSADWVFRLFFDPLAAIVLPSFVLHLTTFIHIARISMKESTEFEMSHPKSLGSASQLSRPPISHRRHVVTAVKIQWRALVLALDALVAFLFYWIFYLIQFPKLSELHKDKAVLSQWVTCMMTEQDQNYCSNIISDKLPPFGIMITAEVLVSVIGIVVFIIFAKRSLWREWNDWIFETRMRFKRTQREYPKTNDQFFAL